MFRNLQASCRASLVKRWYEDEWVIASVVLVSCCGSCWLSDKTDSSSTNRIVLALFLGGGGSSSEELLYDEFEELELLEPEGSAKHKVRIVRFIKTNIFMTALSNQD